MKRNNAPLFVVGLTLVATVLWAGQSYQVRELPPATGTAARSAGESFKPLPRLDAVQIAEEGTVGNSPSAQKMKAAMAELEAFYKKDESRTKMLQLMNVIRLANQQSGIRRKIDEARQEVRDYVRETAPDLLPYLEKMNAARDLSRRQNQLTEIVF
jgi:hypothetical protein